VFVPVARICGHQFFAPLTGDIENFVARNMPKKISRTLRERESLFATKNKE